MSNFFEQFAKISANLTAFISFRGCIRLSSMLVYKNENN
ncbi:hypothetical protein HPS12939_0583 [Glaesserella parasuis 12939]|nr:hypothetical protein HPSMNH_1247 [Glaesserella parasuis MN-H]EQA01662.1 hypothetical protein HPSNAG_1239 [Glaesserella parasuis str. Nagasaki]EQA05892.1 hypothetical protein HPS12939_0583 [Glaesserella parasuis 12939]EQA09753.1 hypothetical protein HPSD74_1274 [Glaesserella parasuis D74]EQA13223.1 hypothetical protein HPS174_0772 [Glaesserella parasuis 174]